MWSHENLTWQPLIFCIRKAQDNSHIGFSDFHVEMSKACGAPSLKSPWGSISLFQSHATIDEHHEISIFYRYLDPVSPGMSDSSPQAVANKFLKSSNFQTSRNFANNLHPWIYKLLQDKNTPRLWMSSSFSQWLMFNLFRVFKHDRSSNLPREVQLRISNITKRIQSVKATFQLDSYSLQHETS